MENTKNELCYNCKSSISTTGYFCGKCLIQFKCKTCEALLEKDNIGCIYCGTPIEKINNAVKRGSNTYHFHEIITENTTERTIDAAFSDLVGKEITDILGNVYNARLNGVPSDHNGTAAYMDNKERYFESPKTPLSINSVKTASDSFQHSTDYPTLNAIAMKNLPNSESEWLLVYAFYSSNYGEKIFTKDDIIEKYNESNRFNKDTTKRDLSSYIKRIVQQGYINPLNTGYSILDPGVEKAKEIISRSSSSAPKMKKVKSKTSKDTSNIEDEKIKKSQKSHSNNGKSLKRLADINFYPKGKDSIEEFFKKFPLKSDNQRNLIFVYYLQEVLDINGITLNHIYTCYDALSLRVSENLPQTVRNTKSRTGWIETEDTKNITVTVKGANQIKSWLKNN